MGKPHDAPAGIDADAEFFLLQRFEIADVPIPYRDPLPHEAVGLGQAQSAFEKDLGQAGMGEDLSTLVFGGVVAEAVEICFGSLISLFAVYAKVK